MDKAVDESNNWKRELSALEAQIPSDESQKRLEVAIKEEVEAAWKQKLSVISEENESLNEMVMFLQQVRQDRCERLPKTFSPSIWMTSCWS